LTNKQGFPPLPVDQVPVKADRCRPAESCGERENYLRFQSPTDLTVSSAANAESQRQLACRQD
jgi:hypothetical protein